MTNEHPWVGVDRVVECSYCGQCLGPDRWVTTLWNVLAHYWLAHTVVGRVVGGFIES